MAYDQQPDLVLVFANGLLEDSAWVRPYLDRAVAVIAADGGLRHLLALGRRPDVLIGDLDSLPPGAEMADAAGEIIRYPTDKNETDLELALLHAVAQYPGHEIRVIGAFGGRLDHLLANILLPAHPHLAGQPIRFLHDHQSAWWVTDETAIHGRPGDTVSLIPLGGPAHILDTTGLRWPLHDEWLHFGPARGISNELTTAQAAVRLGSGALLVVHVEQ